MHCSLSFLFRIIKLLNYLRQIVLFLIRTNVKEQQQWSWVVVVVMVVMASEVKLIWISCVCALNAITFCVYVFWSCFESNWLLNDVVVLHVWILLAYYCCLRFFLFDYFVFLFQFWKVDSLQRRAQINLTFVRFNAIFKT